MKYMVVKIRESITLELLEQSCHHSQVKHLRSSHFEGLLGVVDEIRYRLISVKYVLS